MKSLGLSLVIWKAKQFTQIFECNQQQNIIFYNEYYQKVGNICTYMHEGKIHDLKFSTGKMRWKIVLLSSFR